MLNLRYYFRLTIAFISRFKLIIFVSVFVGIFTFVFFRVFAPTIFGKNVDRIGIPGRFSTDSLPDYILSQVSEGLTQVGPDGMAKPGLATSWSTPDKGKTWIFKLDDKIIWQDGTKLTSDTVNYDFSDVTIQRPDEQTLVYKLTNAYGAFPSIVSKPTFKKGFLGVGEWKITNVTASDSYVQALTMVDKAGTKKIYKFYPTEEDAKLAYKLGQVDELDEIYDPTPFDSWNTSVVSSFSDYSKIAAIFLNTQDPILSSKNIRQALAYSINKDNLGGERAISPISKTSWVYNPQVKSYAYDPTRAKELLSDIPDSQKSSLNVNLVTSPSFLNVANSISKDWEAIGFKTNVKLFAGIPTDYQAFLVIFDVPKDPDQYVLWHSTQTQTNISHYQKNPRIDKLLEDGRIEVDPDKRKPIYFDFQRFLLEDSPAIFLYYPTTYTITRK